MVELFKELLSSMSGNVTRSSCMAPFQWILGIMLAGVVAVLLADGPEWLVVSLAVLVSVCLVIFLLIAVLFALKSPDNLRSERYSIHKMAIERGLLGDSVVGLVEPDSAAASPHHQTPPVLEGESNE